jgi:trehalose 6-phosphate synthase
MANASSRRVSCSSAGALAHRSRVRLGSRKRRKEVTTFMSPKSQEWKLDAASFVVVANRLPVEQIELPDGSTDWRPSPGGLVTAFDPIMHSRRGAWIGWHGAADEELEPFEDDGLTLVPVPLSASDVAEYYEGFSNGTLWPLYHDAIATPQFHREWWDTYVSVNQRFADRTAKVAARGAVVWVQDYQLQLVPRMLRRQRPDLRIGFFLHIPFPPTELFQQLPWRDQILDGLLGADLVGFQLPGGAQNFVRLVRNRLGLETVRDRIRLSDGREVRARAYPIAIDAKGLNELAATEEAAKRAAEIRHDLGDPPVMFLGVDRLDYTKGLLERIQAFGELIAEGRIDPDDAVLLQLAIPSRERVDLYRQLRDDIDRLVGRINAESPRIGRPPITYLHVSYPRIEMAAIYRAADVMLVTPLRDGMNLVAKEYVACRQQDDGALVLSEFTGAARELRQAYLVNPHDINGLKDRMLEAVNDSPRNKARRMRVMRRQVFENDIEKWASRFLDDLEELNGARPANRVAG